jgi:hypothetical protein
MIRSVIAILFFSFSFLVQGQSFPVNYISPSNVNWSKKNLPSEILASKDLDKWLKDVYQDGISNWSYIELFGGKEQQILLQASSPSSGGMNFLILNKTSKGWKYLIDIHGGFIFYPVPSNKHKLIIYKKSGLEYFRVELAFDGVKYSKISSYEVPLELTRLYNSPVDFHKFFWFMNGEGIK